MGHSERDDSADKPTRKQLIYGYSAGTVLVVSTFIGLAIGYYLDGVFNTKPWLTIIFLILGIISGFRELFRFVRKQDRLSSNGSDKGDR